MLQTFKNGQGSIVLRVKLLDSSATTGAGLTGLTSASSGLIISTIADNEASATAYTVAGSTIETITTLGTYAAPTATKCRFKEVDATNHKGIYELHIADARFAVSSAKSLIVSLVGATNLAQADFVVQLQSDDPYVAKPTNSNLLSVDSNGRVDVIKVAGTTQTAGDIIGDTNDIQNRLPAALVSGRMDASVGAMAANVITAAATASDFTTEVVSGLSTLDAAGVRAAVGLSSANLGTQLSTIDDFLDTEIAAIKAVTDKFDTALELDGSVYRLTTNALELAPSGSGSGLDAAGVRAAIGLASANLDTQLDALPTAVEIADAVHDEVVDGTTTFRQSMRLHNAVLGGKASGLATTTASYRDLADSKDRVVATVDADGNRTAVTRDLA